MELSSRRGFMKAAVSASVFAAAAPHNLLGKIIPEFKGDGDNILGLFTVKLADYPILNQVFGSVKITFKGTGLTSKTAIITRTSPTTFVACSDVCTHSGCSVDEYDSSSMHLNCPCHGSTFKPDGTRVQGPAGSNLTPYAVTFTGGDSFQIEVSGLVNGIEDLTDSSNYLREVSPNIVIDSAEVEFGLFSADTVVLAIHNTLGIEILRLADGRFERGDYRFRIPTNQLSSGMYFCSIITEKGFKVSRKFTVVK